MKNDFIKITGLKKSFGDFEVLKGIDLNVAEQEVVVIIGICIIAGIKKQ